ncbi:MAG: 30S ribosomal protein S15 [Candidatus Bathyarchaeia archaeon]
MPKKERGRSESTRPIVKRSPSWCRYQPEEVEALVIKLAKDGNPPSKIGVILRDQYGIPLVRPVTGKTITEILKGNGLGPEIPEDLDAQLKKAARLHVHLENNRKDRNNMKALQAVEAKIRRLAKYYKSKGVLPEDWKYTSATYVFR